MKQDLPIALKLGGVSKRFDRLAVDELDLTVYGGEFYALVGPNGAGKTTTLRMVVGAPMQVRSASTASTPSRTRWAPSKSRPGCRTSR